MISDSSSTSDLSPYPTSREVSAASDAREGPPPVAVPTFDSGESRPAAARVDHLSEPFADVAAGVPLPPPPPPVLRTGAAPAAEEPVAEPFWRWLKRLPLALLLGFVNWYREDGFWYVTSTVAHAVGLFSLALISLAIPQTVLVMHTDAPSFEAAKVDNTPMPEIAHFELGKAPLDPSELNAETLAQVEALPMGAAEEKHYDDSNDFEEAGGGTASDLKGPKLGGLGGFDIKALGLGPAVKGQGGVGVGAGFGHNPGSGGDNIGFGGRGKGHLLKGATKASERAVGAALNWLHRHQTAHGKWSLDFRHQCKGGTCSGPGFSQSDAAATALALLPFLGAGQTHKSRGPYQPTIAKGLAWLIKQQRADGDLSGGCEQPMYAQGLATIVLCEAYGMTHDEHVGVAARLAVGYIERAQNESTGGWRYQPGDSGDTSVFGWQIMALKSAQLAGLPVNSIVFDNAQRWLHSVAKGEHLGLYSYQPYQQVTPTMTAVGMLGRQYMGLDPKDPGMLEGKRSLMENLPDNTLGRNTYYWYYATLTMHNFQDADWDVWNRKMRRALIETQVHGGCAEGSWDPEKPTADTWGRNGGRLMTTSFSALILEVYYRHMPLFRTDSFLPEPGGVKGITEHAEEKAGQ